MNLANDRCAMVAQILKLISQRALMMGDNITRAHAEHAIDLLKKEVDDQLSYLLQEQAS